MKRSDIIERMAFFWLRLDDPNSEYAQSLSLEDKMNHLLNMLEEAGMKPPGLTNGKFFNKIDYKWESEDDVSQT